MVPFPPCGPPLLGCLLAWTLVLAPCFLFSPFLGCFLSIKFGRVSSHLDSGYVKSLVVHITKPLLILQKKVQIRFDLESRPDSTYYSHPQNYLANVVQSIKSNTTYLITTCDDLSKRKPACLENCTQKHLCICLHRKPELHLQSRVGSGSNENLIPWSSSRSSKIMSLSIRLM